MLQGFLATEAFITAKGNRAVKNPILWGRVVRTHACSATDLCLMSSQS